MEEEFIIKNSSYGDAPYLVEYNTYSENIHRSFSGTYDMCHKLLCYYKNKYRSRMKGNFTIVNKKVELRNKKIDNIKQKIIENR